MKIFKKWWWYSTGFHLHKIIWAGIKNLFKWTPIVWKDRDFDFHYILDVLYFKLRNTARYLERNDRFVNTAYHVSKIKLCMNLIDKINEEYYYSEPHDYYESKMILEKSKSGLNTYSSQRINDNLHLYLAKYPSSFRKVEKEGLDNWQIAIRMAQLRHKKAIYLLFAIMNENIENWWD
jgi:hypothetical protein